MAGRQRALQRSTASPRSSAMAAVPRHRRFLGGFICGAAAGAAASCWAAWRLLRSQSQAEPKPVEESLLEKYGFPEAGTETRCYTNHALSYDQAKRVPRWVIEHISKQKTLGNADRRHCKFRPDPNIPLMFSAVNEDYLGSGWSRGHMVPAGDNKFSTEECRVERHGLVFFPHCIITHSKKGDHELSKHCREVLFKHTSGVIVIDFGSLPQTKNPSVIGKDDVAVPSHLYKVILARRTRTSTEPLALGAFVVPNDPIGFSHQLPEFQVNIEDLEKMSGLVFFPQVDKTKDVKDICEVDTCKLMGFKEFTLYVVTRKVQSARTLHRLEKAMSELKEAGIEPDEYLLKLHKKKEEELQQEKQVAAREGRAG
uniref:Nuclease EXOG, mitochondrial n=1 Tax=Pavo cristatus TaxID=9049 RepID=A0A8C9FD93_PAVCR